MSVRTHVSKPSLASKPSTTIDFKSDFVNSTAVFAASHDETVSHILTRLDQLQSKVSAQPEQTPTARAPRPPANDLHARIAALEDIHENALHKLDSKLDGVERKLSDTKEAESLMGRIASKFSNIESQLASNKESEALMSNIASKFALVENKLQSATQLSDRVVRLEGLQSRIAKLESHLKPDPEQDRILSRINSKMDQLERQQGSKTVDFVGSERDERINYLQERIGKLRELKAKYEIEDNGSRLCA
jgi:hypothetical protein